MPPPACLRCRRYLHRFWVCLPLPAGYLPAFGGRWAAPYLFLDTSACLLPAFWVQEVCLPAVLPAGWMRLGGCRFMPFCLHQFCCTVTTCVFGSAAFVSACRSATWDAASWVSFLPGCSCVEPAACLPLPACRLGFCLPFACLPFVLPPP